MTAVPRRPIRATLALAAALTMGLSACGGAKVSADGTAAANNAASCVDTSGDSIKIGFLNSLSGTMAISEKTVNDSLNLAAEEINAGGGVLGKKLQVVTEDGASEPTKFAEKARKLITADCTAAVFGGWTSASRKAMLPVFEGGQLAAVLPRAVRGSGGVEEHLLFRRDHQSADHPGPGLPARKGRQVALPVGSDYVFPRTANKIITAYAKEHGMEIKGEEYAPLGHTDFSTIVGKVRSANADAVFNTLNGDSNVAFFKEYRNAGLTADTMPVMSVSIAEEEVGGIGVDNVQNQLVAWNYYETVDSPQNRTFVQAFKAKYGQNRVTSDPMEPPTPRCTCGRRWSRRPAPSTPRRSRTPPTGSPSTPPRRARSPSTARTTTSPRPPGSARSTAPA